jgi:predicted methyltransferase
MRIPYVVGSSVALFVLACAGSPASPPPNGPTAPTGGAVAAVDAPDRDADDKTMDAGRHPKEMLSFFGIAPGMKVADLGAGRGYTSELLARTVGDGGKVWGENPAKLLGFVGKEWEARLAKPVMKNVVRVDRELDDPLPADATGLDAVVMVLIYHDAVWLGVDRDKMNHAVFAALKPGGVFGIVDHSAKAGDGTKVAQTLHRIEESAVVEEVKRAGFVLDGTADFLKNPNDARDWNDSPGSAGDKRGTSDRFVLRFKKP